MDRPHFTGRGVPMQPDDAPAFEMLVLCIRLSVCVAAFASPSVPRMERTDRAKFIPRGNL